MIFKFLEKVFILVYSNKVIYMNEQFWIFINLGLGDAIVANGLIRHYANIHKDKMVIIPCWEKNLAAIQWMLSDVPNIHFYPIETEQQILMCLEQVHFENKITLGFYSNVHGVNHREVSDAYKFNPVKWDSEFYRQAGLDPELKWSGFKLPEFDKKYPYGNGLYGICHEDKERGFLIINHESKYNLWPIKKENGIKKTVEDIYFATEIHCIDSSMLNLADLMETPNCKRFVYHKYARRGLPPTLYKPWEILE